MNLVGLREAVRSTIAGEKVDLSSLDESSARAFAAWRDKHHRANLSACEPSATYSDWDVPTRATK